MSRATPAAHPLEYLDTADAVRRWVDSIAATDRIAIDTEGASFHRYLDRIYLLQLTVPARSAIIDPLPIGTPEGLGALLEDPQVEVVFHDADYDLRLLHQDYGWNVRNIFDTRIAAQLIGLKAFGLAALLERYFGIRLDKKHQRADWSMRPLTQDMLDYAALDTRWLLDLRDRLHEELAKRDRLGWAAEEFKRLEGTRWAAEDPSTAFLRVKGARDLTRRELARLRELVIWRDDVADTLDRSTFRVMSNEVLLEIARTAPTTRDALLRIKGAPKGLVDARSADILACVARGDAVPEKELPRFPKSPRWDRDPDFDARVARLKGVRDAAAARLELDPGVLCSRDRMESIARLNPPGVEGMTVIPELRRWQLEVLGEGFLEALRTGGTAVPAAGDSAGAGAADAATDGGAVTPPATGESPYRE